MIYDILCRNAGNVLTPELIEGIMLTFENQQTPQVCPLWEQVPESLRCIDYQGYQFQVVPLATVYEAIRKQNQAQWDEVEIVRGELNYDYDRALRSEQEGVRLQAIVTDNKGMVVGNSACYVLKSMHTQKLMATEDTFYLSPEHRKGRLALHFLKYCVNVIRSLHVKQISVTTKVNNDVSKLWERGGFQLTDKMFTMILED